METPDEHADDTPGDLAPAEYPPPPMAARQGRGFTIGAFICAALSLLVFPIILGPIGVILSIYGKRKGDPLAQKAMIATIGAMVVSIIFWAIVGGNGDGEALAVLAA
ncbi:MAG: hypothetical protein JWN67_1070 [Actinomycetia bacterium]|nr:hypothetical protein [Actinomycetes bacterium]